MKVYARYVVEWMDEHGNSHSNTFKGQSARVAALVDARRLRALKLDAKVYCERVERFLVNVDSRATEIKRGHSRL